MAGITLAQAQAKLNLWLDADAAVAGNQSYEIAGRSLTRANAAEIRKNIEFWDAKCKELDPTGSRPALTIFAGVPVDG